MGGEEEVRYRCHLKDFMFSILGNLQGITQNPISKVLLYTVLLKTKLTVKTTRSIKRKGIGFFHQSKNTKEPQTQSLDFPLQWSFFY